MMWGWGEWHKLRHPTERKKRNWKNPREWIWPSIVGVFFTFIVLFMRWPPNLFSILTIMGVIVFVWSRVWEGFYRPPTWLDDEYRPLIKEAVLMGPPILLAVFVWGLVDAASDLESDDPYVLHLKNREYASPKAFLRSFDKGILVKDWTSHDVQFLRWEDIATIERLSVGKTRTLACSIFDWCLPARPLPPMP
jgi:hypothetical protein